MTSESSDTIRTMWVVLRRSRHPRTMDEVTVAFRSESRFEAESFMLGARKVTEEWSPGTAIYELGEC